MNSYLIVVTNRKIYIDNLSLSLMIKITEKQNIGEYFYKAANITTIVGGLLVGHGLGNALTRGDAQSWIELGAGLLMATGSVIYRFHNSDKYDPQIRGIKNQIGRLEEEIRTSEEREVAIQSKIRNNELLINAYMRRN